MGRIIQVGEREHGMSEELKCSRHIMGWKMARVTIVVEVMVMSGLQQGKYRIRREGSLWQKSPP